MHNKIRSPENFIYLKQCPVCESTSMVNYKKNTFNIYSLDKESIKITDSAYGQTWDLSRCRDCCHVFANPCPSPSYIQSLYGEIEDPLYEEEALGRAKNFQRILSQLEKIGPEKGPLFDVGAAPGILLDSARRKGWIPDGIEPSVWAVKIAREKYGLDLQVGNFEKAETKTNYTAVTMIDFIEHVPQPREAVQKAFAILSPGGTLCVVTPNIRSLAARISGNKWWHFRPAHLSYFTKASLTALLEISGFQIIKIRKYSWTFSTHYLISRLKGLNFLIKNTRIASFWKKIPIKLALGDSFEVYARKKS